MQCTIHGHTEKMAHRINGHRFCKTASTSDRYSSNTNHGLENFVHYETRENRLKHGDFKSRHKLLYKPVNTDSVSEVEKNGKIPAARTLLNETQKYKWPMLNTKDKGRIQKEKQLHTLMTDIDDLMIDVGLTDRKSDPANFTYEVLMLGSGEMNNTEKLIPKKKSVATKFAARAFNPTKDRKVVRKSEEQTDTFVDELEKMLDECEMKH